MAQAPGFFPVNRLPTTSTARQGAPIQSMATQQQQLPQQQFGLSGSEQALSAALGGGVSALQQGQQQALGTLGLGQDISQQQLAQGRQALGGGFGAQALQVDPNTGQSLFQQAAAGVGAFSPAGLRAQGLQAALSGVQGQQAFDTALIDNPLQNFLNQRGQEALLNQAAATGGVGSGQFQTELQQLGQAQAGQQLQQQIANLAGLSQQGLQAAGQQGQFLSQAGQQQGSLAAQNAQLGTNVNLTNAGRQLQAAQGVSNLFGQGAGLSAGLAGQGAGIQVGTGRDITNLLAGTGGQISQGRLQAGRDIAGQIGQVSSGVSNIAGQQGAGISDIIGQGSGNLANILSGSGQFTSQQQTQLAQLLAGLATGQGTQLSNIALTQGGQNAQSALAQGVNQQQLISNLVGAAGAGGLLNP